MNGEQRTMLKALIDQARRARLEQDGGYVAVEIRATREEKRFLAAGHGTLARYKTNKCRCSRCRAANRAYVRDMRIAGARIAGAR